MQILFGSCGNRIQTMSVTVQVHHTPRQAISSTTLTLIQSASMRTYWATLRRHSCLLRAAASVSSQLSPILRRSLLITPIQFAFGRSEIRNLPGVLAVCADGLSVSNDRTSAVFFFIEMFSMLCCLVRALTSSFVSLSFRKTNNLLLCHPCTAYTPNQMLPVLAYAVYGRLC